MTPRTVEADGCRLAYWVAGSGPPVLFVQGVGAQGAAWTPQTDALAGRFTCVWFDNRGMGRSQPAGGPFTVERMAADARAVLDAAGVGPAHVVGHSLGGLVSLALALANPDRVWSLALLCTFADGRAVAPLTPRMIWLGLGTVVGPRRSRRRAFLRLVLPPDAYAACDPDARAAELADLFGHDLADQPPVAKDQLLAMRGFDATPRLGELAGVPTLVASAAHDLIAPPALGRAVAAGIPGAVFEEHADAAHGLPLQHPARVNARLADHFTRADGRR
ncbi:MAG: alpha/beta fold hydrolase [Gemmataceae bacterium]